jgi:hypothetical protein
MVGLLFTGVSGWILVVLVAATAALPFAIRRGAFAGPQPGARPRAFLERLRPHYFLGYAIVGLVLVHGSVPLGVGLATRVQSLGLNLAGVALILIGLQMLLGRGLRDPKRRDRRGLRRTHLITTLAVMVTAGAHIALNSSLRDLF